MAQKAKVLVIDDDADTLVATRSLLEGRGFEVATSATPEDGLRLLEQDRPDAVVLDVMMPHGTEGFDWLWKIRHHPDAAVRRVPVVVVTSLHQTTDLRFHEGDADETGEYLPAQAFLDKPVDPDVLAGKIRSLLPADT